MDPGIDYADDCTVATLDGTVPALVILGRTGAGKLDIAKNIFNEDPKKPWPALTGCGSVAASTRSPSKVLHQGLHELIDVGTENDKVKVRVIIMDTYGLGGHTSHHEILEKIKEITNSINIIFFVMKYGRVTSEDCKPIDEIITELRKMNVGIEKSCYLLVTGCECQSEASRNGVDTLYKEDPMTCGICSFVAQVIPVGFPDLESTDQELHKNYQKAIEKDKGELHGTVKKSLHTSYKITLAKKTSCNIY